MVEHVGALDTRDGSLRRLADIKRAMLYRVTSLAYDPDSGTVFYTNDNLALRDLMAVDVETGEERMLLEDARIGEIVFDPVDRSLVGVRHDNGLATLVRIPYPYDDWNEVRTFPYGVVPYDLDISPDGRLLSASMGEVNGDQFLRVWELEKLLAGDVKPLSEFRFGQSVPESFVFSPDGRYLYGSSYYTGRVQHLPLRGRHRRRRGGLERGDSASSARCRSPTAGWWCSTTPAQGSFPPIIEPHPIEDVSAITFLGAEVAEKYPVVKTWQVPPPSTVDEEKLITAKGRAIPYRDMSLANAYPVLQGYKNTAGVGYHVNFEDPLGFASLGHHCRVYA